MVSDLTYVRVGAKWAYICILLDLGAREIIGYSGGAYKNADLVHKAFSTVKGSLFGIQMFHTDRGSEFDNALIDELARQLPDQPFVEHEGLTLRQRGGRVHVQDDQGGVRFLSPL